MRSVSGRYRSTGSLLRCEFRTVTTVIVHCPPSRTGPEGRETGQGEIGGGRERSSDGDTGTITSVRDRRDGSSGWGRVGDLGRRGGPSRGRRSHAQEGCRVCRYVNKTKDSQERPSRP